MPPPPDGGGDQQKRVETHLVGARPNARDFALTKRYGMSLPAAHCSLILATRITLPHFSVSSEINLPKSAGEPASTVPPKLASFVSRLASAMLTLTAVFSFSMTSAGVFFGAPMP